jgi:hypothetical protein
VTRRLAGAGHSGQGGVDPEVWLAVLPFIRRCHGASVSVRCRTAVLQGMPGPRAGSSHRRRAHASTRRDRPSLASRVSSDAVDAGGNRHGHTGTAAAVVLEVRRTFVSNRLSAGYLAAAYAQVIPTHQRRTRLADRAQVPIAEVTWRRAVEEGRGIRDV